MRRLLMTNSDVITRKSRTAVEVDEELHETVNVIMHKLFTHLRQAYERYYHERYLSDASLHSVAVPIPCVLMIYAGGSPLTVVS